MNTKLLNDGHAKETLWLEIFKIVYLAGETQDIEQVMEKSTKIYKYMKSLQE